MIKTSLAFVLLLFSTWAAAETCTVAIRDQFGYDYDIFFSSSYSTSSACSDATWNCRQRLSEYQSRGMHYDSLCVIRTVSPTYPAPPIPPSYPRDPHYPREPQYPRYPREPSYPRNPYPAPRDPREPPRHDPGSEPRYPGPRPSPRPEPRPMPGPGRGPRPRTVLELEIDE